MTQNPEILTDVEIAGLESYVKSWLGIKNEKGENMAYMPEVARIVATIRALKKELELLGKVFYDSRVESALTIAKLSEEVAEFKKEIERLNNIIGSLMNPRMIHGHLQGPLTEE